MPLYLNALLTSLPPFAWFFIGALLLLFFANRRFDHFVNVISLLSPVLSFIALLQWQHGEYGTYQLFDLELTLTHIDKLSFLFATIFHIAALIAVIFALHIRDRVQQVAALAYAGSAIGAVFAGDWITLFIFWELLAITSVFLILARRTEASYRSSLRYLIYQVLSGVLLFAGALIVIKQSGSASMVPLSLGVDWLSKNHLGEILIFLALGMKCGFPLFHNWITDSYPESTATGAVFLSALSTKVAVYAMARTFAGEEVLISIGLIMACVPIFYAAIENDLRRVLAYSLICQIGFMICGIGIGTEMAINGAVATAFNHVIYKSLLMMSMGAVLLRVGHVDATSLGGLYRSMPKTSIFCIIGSIAAFPLFSGFVSKAIIMSEMLYAGRIVGWLLLLFATAGIFLHAGIKVPYFAFFAKGRSHIVKEAPGNMLLAMALASLLSLAVGVYPQWLYSLLPFTMDYSPYDLTHVLTQLQLLLFSGLAFLWLNSKGLYPPAIASINLDIDWFYRRAFPCLWKAMEHRVIALWQNVLLKCGEILNRLYQLTQRYTHADAILGRSWGVNSMLMAMLSVMIIILTINYWW